MQPQLLIEHNSFIEARKRKLDVVDNTLFIKEILDNRNVCATLITRPPYFGKTFNLSMLQCFLASDVDGEPTEGLFDGLNITHVEGDYMQHQGKYLVVFVTFKHVDGANFECALEKLADLMSELYKNYYYLLASEHLQSMDKTEFQEILEKKARRVTLEHSLQCLTRLLFLHHRVDPWVLIDGYDSPIQSARLNGYYKEMLNFIQGMFGSALKGNSYLNRGVLTGTSQEILDSGLNNVVVYTITDKRYSEYFKLHTSTT